MKNKNNENADYKIVKDINQKKTSDIIKFGNDFMKEFLFDENENAIDIQITSLRIIFLIYNTFNSTNDANLLMFQPKSEPKQLKLFDEEFETDNNLYVRVTLKNSQISADQNKIHLEKAFEFLTEFKKQWYTSYNAEGQKIRSYGGLINMPTYDEKGCTSFLISSYWLKKIIQIDTYEYFLLQTAFKISSSKDILFLLWLSRINKTNGTTISLDLLNQRFNLNYKTTKDISDKFLAPLRKRLDANSLLSFNHSRKGNNLIIIPYTNTPKFKLSQETNEKVETIYKLHYLKKRHNLAGKNFDRFKILYEQKNVNNKLEISKAYDRLKINFKSQKIALTTLQGDAFLKVLQDIIIEIYKASPAYENLPNGFLKFI
ncbi:hypothetical protein CMT22_17735 [Elizabethkingia anophelis]|nr:hypothetical protein [Elizabethkingia anophelis]